MALTIKKSITLDGNSAFNGVIAETYRAVINDENPEDMTITSYQQNKQTYKENRIQCRKDSAEFEETAYALQDEMIQANAVTTDTTTE